MELARYLPRREFPTFVFLLAIATLLAFVSTGQAGAALLYGGEQVPWIGLLRARVVDWYLCFLFLPLLCWLARVRPISRRTLATALPVHFAASLGCALTKEILFVLIGNWFRPGVFHLPEILAGDYFDEVLLFWAMIGLIHALLTPPQPRSRAAPAEERGPAGFVVRTGGAWRHIPVAEVGWIEAQGNYACLHTGAGAPLVRETMAALEQRLGPCFVRVHRRAIVNRRKIARIEACSHGAYRIILESGEALASGRSYNKAVRALLG